jgi:signal transduction histidine kinase/DNA-binding response OmpR family regulator
VETETTEITQVLIDKDLIKVLLVEDDAIDRLLIERVLGGCPQPIEFAADGAGSLSAAVECLSNGKYDVILLDLMLPDSKGLETIRRIKEINSHVPIVVLTGLDDEQTGFSAIKTGAMDYLVKDQVLTNVLVRTIRYAIERNRMQEALRTKTALLEAQTNATIDGILVTDEKQKRVLINQQIIKLFALPQHLVENEDGKPLLRYIADKVKNPEQFIKKVSFLYSHRNEKSRDELEFKNGMTFDGYSSPVVSKDGKYFGRIWTFRDISYRKKAESTTVLAYSRVVQTNRELREMQSQLVQTEKLASIGQLAAGIAHEMNNPVGFVASNFETLEGYVTKFESLMLIHENLLKEVKSVGSESLRKKAEMVESTRNNMKMDFVLADIQQLCKDSKDGLHRVTGIIQSLRDFSRIDQPGAFSEYKINEGILATLVVVGNEIKYHCDVKTELGEVPAVTCNPGQINQVMLNIIVNASQAVTSQERQGMGNITIKTYATDKHVVCEISDDGPGIPKELFTKIFDPFFTTKPVGKGTGLGLSVSYDIIVNKHKGKLLVDSVVGKGATFTIKLPLTGNNQTPNVG